MFDLRDSDFPKGYAPTMENGPVSRAFRSGYETCHDKMFKPIEETGMRVCPFCENDYVKVRSDVHMRNEILVGEAMGVCGACGCRGPVVMAEIRNGSRTEDILKLEDDAKSLWNRIEPWSGS